LSALVLFGLMLQGMPAALTPDTALADHTPNPSSVTVAGSLQSELGCPGDWQPECAATHLSYDANDDVWQGTFDVPAGSYEYKAPLNDSWDENYGRYATQNGDNIPLSLGSNSPVKFYYDHKSHWITSNKNAAIAVAPGSFQSELGCPGDWDPGCLRSWLQDPEEDGTYTFETTALPAGNYETKVAHNEGWDENYGQNGEPNGPNIPFTVPFNNALMTFSYNLSTHILTITAPGHAHDNNVEWYGLGHNSQDLIYRQPFGATNPNTPITLRFRTFHNDVTAVRARLYDTATSSETVQAMHIAVSDVGCYDPGLAADTCDFWQTVVTPTQLTTLYYRFIVTDGTDVDYYDDDNFKDGGWGEPQDTVRDNSYAITVFDPAFEPVPWMQDAVIYQIFPDRFRNGRTSNDPNGSEPRYTYPTNLLDKILRYAWSALPEGYCRHYENPGTACNEEPRGRDYFGGDLKGIDQALDYLQAQGVNTIYMNPVFDAASNHAYDTQDYFKIDPFFGTQKDWDNLQRHAAQHGMHIILDGVFNHVSSDSKYFDRYHHFADVGACENVNSPYRSWFFFTPQANGPCAGPNGQNTMNYAAWFGFDSLPVLNKNEQAVRNLVYAAPGNGDITQYWLNNGASGWRLDVMGDGSFPAEFWQQFRAAVKAVNANAPIIGELWKKDEMLPKVHGDQADTGMNYRFRNAILGFFGEVDNKGFADDGQYNQTPTLFAQKLNSVREDYPDATYYTLMNLMDSHDTQRILWNLSWQGTPNDRNRENREFNAANVAVGKQKLRQAAAVQFTIPGAPTVYYGDEVGVTGDDDPDDRRTFPWLNDLPNGALNPGGDAALRTYYAQLAQIRAANPVLRDGELKFLLTDDANRTMAYGMKTEGNVAIVAVNRNETSAKTLTIPLSGYLRNGVAFTNALGGGPATSAGGNLTVNLPALGVAIYLMNAGQDITPLGAPVISAAAGDRQATITWAAVPGAASYNVYRSPLSGGGYVLAGSSATNSYTDTGLQNARTYYYVVTSVDALGNESGWSNEVDAIPHYTIGWANLQWPYSINHIISTTNRTELIYGRVWIDGVTNQPGPTESLIAQAGYGPQGSNPAGNPQWTWVDAEFNVDVDNNDEFKASLLPEALGTFNYVYRYSTTAGDEWVYADRNGIFTGTPPNPGVLTVVSSGDTTPPSVPGNLRVTDFNASAITLGWDASPESDVNRYEVLRGGTAGGPYTRIGSVIGASNTQYIDTDVVTGATYYYVVRAVDTSWNRSANSNEVQGTALRRQVAVTFNATVPATTDGTGRTVHIAGDFPPPYPQWAPDAADLALTRLDATHWRINLSLPEGTQLQYKYALGSWDYVEKGPACDEINNRQLTVVYGSNGTQTVNDTVANWRNVAPCGN
jgi:glycosidase